MTISHEEAEQMGWDAVFDMEKNEATEIDRLRDIIHELLDSCGHMCSGLHDIEEMYQVDTKRAQEIRDAAKALKP